jgi:formate-dependent phosphoribosylglycinamide formyltransferase (GAR transformylase)
MRVLMISPGFPAEMPFFTRGLAKAGAAVVGMGDQPAGALPDAARESLSDYIHVSSLWDEDAVVEEVRRYAHSFRLDRVECLWEPGMLLAARLREALGLPGLNVAQTTPFRDKGAMKEVLDAAGIRTPRHFRTKTTTGCREAAERIGYPLIIKPIDGAGSADTYRVDGEADLEAILPRIGHVEEVSVEEFIEGEEYTFDTICADGEILYSNISWYRPRPLLARSLEWISPQTVCLKDMDAPYLASGREMGRRVIEALGFRTGFTHMEWFLLPDGEAVFGEIGGRPPGARSTEIMNYCSDMDVFTGWGEAVVRRSLSQSTERRYNSGVIFKRAQGEGRIAQIEGLSSLLGRYGSHIVSVELLPPGAPRRDWRQTLLSDGWLILRHPDLKTLMEMLDRVGTDLQIYAEPGPTSG